MLTGELIYLSPVTEGDLPALWRWINAREEVVNNAPYRPISSVEHASWFSGLAASKDTVIFGIRTVTSDSLVGTCQLTGIHSVHRSAELRIRIGDGDQRGRGFGREAVDLLLRHGFDDLNLHRVHLEVFATNARALSTYERCGFRHEGRLRDAAFLNGGWVDIVIMGILRDEFA